MAQPLLHHPWHLRDPAREQGGSAPGHHCCCLHNPSTATGSLGHSPQVTALAPSEGPRLPLGAAGHPRHSSAASKLAHCSPNRAAGQREALLPAPCQSPTANFSAPTLTTGARKRTKRNPPQTEGAEDTGSGEQQRRKSAGGGLGAHQLLSPSRLLGPYLPLAKASLANEQAKSSRGQPWGAASPGRAWAQQQPPS